MVGQFNEKRFSLNMQLTAFLALLLATSSAFAQVDDQGFRKQTMRSQISSRAAFQLDLETTKQHLIELRRSPIYKEAYLLCKQKSFWRYASTSYETARELADLMLSAALFDLQPTVRFWRNQAVSPETAVRLNSEAFYAGLADCVQDSGDLKNAEQTLHLMYMAHVAGVGVSVGVAWEVAAFVRAKLALVSLWSKLPALAKTGITVAAAGWGMKALFDALEYKKAVESGTDEATRRLEEMKEAIREDGVELHAVTLLILEGRLQTLRKRLSEAEVRKLPEAEKKKLSLDIEKLEIGIKNLKERRSSHMIGKEVK